MIKTVRRISCAQRDARSAQDAGRGPPLRAFATVDHNARIEQLRGRHAWGWATEKEAATVPPRRHRSARSAPRRSTLGGAAPQARAIVSLRTLASAAAAAAYDGLTPAFEPQNTATRLISNGMVAAERRSASCGLVTESSAWCRRGKKQVSSPLFRQRGEFKLSRSWFI